MSAAILILAQQPVVAALVGILVELAGYQPVFAEPGEPPTEAVQRISPRVVVLIDLALDDSRSDLFFVQAAKRRVGVAIFGPTQREAAIVELAAARGVAWFTIPPDTDQLARVIEAAASSEWWLRTGDRRQAVEPDGAPGGALTFTDKAGFRWTVSDRRRGGDRRIAATEDGAKESIIDRFFVNDAGEEFSCELRLDDLRDLTPFGLQRQLDRALPV